MDRSTQQGDHQSLDSSEAVANALMAKFNTPEQEAALEDENRVTDDVTENESDADDEIEVSPEIEAAAEESEETEETDELEASEEESEDEVDEPQNVETFETVAELAEATGMELDEFLSSIRLTTKVDGQESEVSLAELKKGFQLTSTFTQRNQQLTEDRKEFDQEREAKRAEIDQQFRNAGTAFALAQQELASEFQNTDWEKLKVDDPNQFLIRQQDFGKKQARLNAAIEASNAEADRIVQERAEEDAKALEAKQIAEHEKLMEKVPEWKDEKVLTEEAGPIGEYLAATGFTSEEMKSMADHRIILLARKAMKFDQATSKVDLTRKRIRKSPKLVKGGAKSTVNPQQKQVGKNRAKLKKTGSLHDAAALLMAKNS